MDYAPIIARIFDHLEDDKIEKAVMGCLRLARHLKDYPSSAIFLRELNPNKHEVARVIFDDASHLTKEAHKYLSEFSLERWLEVHTLDYSLGQNEDGDDRNVLRVGAGEIDSELDQWERTIGDMALPSGMAPFDIAVFTDRNAQEKATIRLRMAALNTIRARLKTRCLNYAIQVERQLQLQTNPQNFLVEVQTEVNNYFRAHSNEIYVKLAKAAQLVASRDSEDSSLLLTEVRRSLKSVADHFFPAMDGLVRCADGKERSLGEEQYMNRLQEFIARNLSRSTAKDLLREELDQLSLFSRRLNDIASKGVHAEVKLAESKQGLIGLYFFLFNLIQHLQTAELSTTASSPN
ncbi:hypothetical protein IB279_17505 [Ensifer sp. ENS06]|uniref:hypothetical protein n=1 Tax=Ensifer sp. ENS06 TaxID=2769276 RepID=UPI001783BD76|nr:hypothetical protein [Ensifer sp. ENS06]MBD9624742.1 hypothetical protein [Ensifer sp. ENS06]